MSKKILFVGLAYYPYLEYGGPIRVMRSYGLALTSQGHEVTIYCSNIVNRQFKRMADRTVQSERDGMRIVYMKTDVCLSDGLTISTDLVRHLKREMTSYDVVHLFGPRDYFVGMAAFYAMKKGIPFFIHPMGAMNYKNSKVVLKFIWDTVLGRRLINGAEYIVEATDEQVGDLLDYGIPAVKTAVIPWCPDPDLTGIPTRSGFFREKFGISRDDLVILFLGRVHRKKGIDLLIRSLAMLKEFSPRLIVVGHDDDGSMGELKELASQLKLEDRVVWAGALHSPESAVAYRDADIFALVSKHESAPMALLEACLMGVPVLISDNLGMSDMVRDRAGVIVDTTTESTAIGLKELLRSAELRKRFGEGGRKLVAEHFSVQAMALKLEKLYKTASI